MRALLAAVVLLTVVAGCGKHNLTGPIPGSTPSYAVPSTPSAVLSNLSLAYSLRDSTAYKAAFDVDYIGTSVDNSYRTPVMYTFHSDDEARHISALAVSHTLTRTILQFLPPLIRFTDLKDPPGWETIQIPSGQFRVEIDDGVTTLSAGFNEMNEFKFIPTTPASASPTDTTWKISRWTEIHN